MLDLDRLRGGWTTGTRDGDAAEQLEAEIAKLGALSGEEPAWPVVRERSLAVLRGSPDLAAAVYFTQASLVLDGFDGLLAGLAIVGELLGERWEALHPPLERQRARRAALAWLGERAARAIATAPDQALLERSIALVADVGAECERRFAEPLLGALRRKLECLRAAPAPADAPIQAPAARPAAPTMVSSRAEAATRLAAAADYFQRCEPHSPVGPLLRRALAWCELGFEDVFRELLSRSPEARNALWETLGLKPEPKR